MIPIPDSLTFTRDKRSENKLLAQARKKLASDVRSQGLHASDLLDPRKTYFRYKTGNKEASLTDYEVMLFLIGKVLHYIVLGAEDEGSKTSELGLDYSVDYLDKGIPTELKTTRQDIPSHLAPLQQYIEQLLIYMACEKQTIGQLWVLFLNAKDETWRTSPQFRCGKVKITKKELGSLRRYIKKLTKSLNISLESKESEPWRLLPLCRKWLCTRQKCKHYDVCKPEERWKPPRKKREPKALLIQVTKGW